MKTNLNTIGAVLSALSAEQTETLKKRLWSKIGKTPSGCWNWTGTASKKGHDLYGKIRLPKTRIVARTHQVAYHLVNGPIPADRLVRHTCDNPKCCNPTHLILGTQADNMRDAKERKRFPAPTPQNGDKNHNAKLTDAQVLEIDSHISSGLNNTEIADEYGVTHSLVSLIRRKKTRPHLWA